MRRDQLQAPFFSGDGHDRYGLTLTLFLFACGNTSVDPPVHELVGSWSLVQVEYSPGLQWVPETEEGFLLDLDQDGTWKDSEGDSGIWETSGNHLTLPSANVGIALEGRYVLQAEESVLTLLVPVPVFNLFLEVLGEEPIPEELLSEEIRFTFKRYSSSE